MTTLDDHYLPGVTFTLDGESVPARELCWAMIAPCGCISGLHMMTEDTITEAMAWKVMGGSAAQLKQDKARGFTLKMSKADDVIQPFRIDCPHTPKWGYAKPPKPEGYSWAASMDTRVLHLVPLTETDKGSEAEWNEQGQLAWDTYVPSLCEKSKTLIRCWTRKWYRTDGKVECARCCKLGDALVASVVHA